MRTLGLIAALLLALGTAACTVDDDVVEGKRCYPTGSDPNKSCVKGYECKCAFGDCLCQKAEPAPSSAESGLLPASATEDPSLRLLRQQGLILTDR